MNDTEADPDFSHEGLLPILPWWVWGPAAFLIFVAVLALAAGALSWS